MPMLYLLRTVLRFGLVSTFLFAGEWLALRGANASWSLVPALQTWKAGSLPFNLICLLELAFISAVVPYGTRTPWRPRQWNAAGALGLGAALFLGPLGFSLLGLVPSPHWHAPLSALSFLSGGVLGPLAEEWAFRGVLWRASEWAVGPTKWAPAIAGAFTSAAFGLWHVPFQDPSAPLPAIVLANVAFGACLAFARWRLQSIAPGVVVHAIGNSFFLLTR
jgi:membrane protease YdiL (CAAX protease family)